MTKIEWTRSALSDARNLRDNIARNSEAYADRFVQKIIEAVEKAAAFPLIGRRVPEADDDTIREILYRKYRIVYRFEPDRILVLMVIHGARDLTQVELEPWEIE
jgi:plasmid stabilization system protein ParE